jgi:phage recombination protein Bet
MSNELTVVYKVDDQEIKLTPKIVQDYLVGTDAEITLPEFKLFTELCKVRKLNPFLREAYLIKYSNKQAASIVVGKDAIMKRAVLNPKYNGMKSGIIVLNDEGEIIERKGTFKLDSEQLVGGWAEVFRKDWENSIYCSVSLSETIQKKSNGEINSNWSKQPATMIEKVAKVRALREAFVEDLGGMYEAEEMNVELPKEEIEQPIIQEEKKEDPFDILDINGGEPLPDELK